MIGAGGGLVVAEQLPAERGERALRGRVPQASVHALGGLVVPHQIIRVTGGGRLNSGSYFVKSVAHTIDPSNHKLRIEMLRNGLGGS